MSEPTTEQGGPTAARKHKPTTDAAAVPVVEPTPVTETATDATRYEPYPGREFFHGGRHSPVFVVMAARLEAEGCTDGRHLGPDWTTAHRDAFATWQRTLRPKEAGDVSGTPDETAWDKLRVPRVTPLPQQESSS
ncbi:hypothetical protein [Streptomyces prasinopilosus]|uniref:hypothetical protein n=1 Tax=Streptomyces prasinopilosus TaxID=67344 RepID=UPI0006EB97EA|nr:hypothetical protein [Streptomyces prasinopilosus]